MKPEKIRFINHDDVWKVIEAEHTCFDGSSFESLGAERMRFKDVSLAGTKITDANLSNLEINYAQMGGAYIHNIDIPVEGDPHYNPETAGLPVRFENCKFVGGQISKCDLRDVEIMECDLKGMKIDGILVEDLLKEYKKSID